MDSFLSMISGIQSQIQMITISDVLDILIVAFVLYRILLLVRQSRGAQVAKAIVIFAVALALSNQLQLNVVNFILGNAVEMGFLALVVVFQPEIRRFLEQVGSSSFGDVFGRTENTSAIAETIDETVAAMASLSKDKVGALMVFERKILLDDVIGTGTPLDCGVSSELLKNIFWNKAPLHDGAVVVRNGRIAGAGCVLPLSGNTNLSKELGMRHRAGIGISENSDAVVVLVSEETGSITVSIGGVLKRHLAPETLTRILEKELLPEQETPRASVFPGLFKSKKGENKDGAQNHRE